MESQTPRARSKTSPEAGHIEPARLEACLPQTSDHPDRRQHFVGLFKHLDIGGELAILVSFRLEFGHISTLHIIKCLRVEFLTLGLMQNICKAYRIVGSTK